MKKKEKTKKRNCRKRKRGVRDEEDGLRRGRTKGRHEGGDEA
jgi:hypothetical protein